MTTVEAIFWLRIIYPNYIFSVDYQAEKHIVYKYVLYTPEYRKYFFTWNVGRWETSLSTVQCVLSAWRSALLSAQRLALFFALGFGSLLLILRMSLLKLLNVHMKNIYRIGIKSKIIKEMSHLILSPNHFLMTSFLCLKYSVKFKIVVKQGNCELMLNEIHSRLLITQSFE